MVSSKPFAIIDETFLPQKLEQRVWVRAMYFLALSALSRFLSLSFFLSFSAFSKRKKKKNEKIVSLVFTLNETFCCTPVVQVMAFINARQRHIYYYGKM